MTISLADLQALALQQQSTGRAPLFGSQQTTPLGPGLAGMVGGGPQLDMMMRQAAGMVGIYPQGIQMGFLNDGPSIMAAARAQMLMSGNAPSLGYAQKMLAEMNVRKAYASLSGPRMSFAEFRASDAGRSAAESGRGFGAQLGPALPFLMPFVPDAIVGEIMSTGTANSLLNFQFGLPGAVATSELVDRMYRDDRYESGNRRLFGYGVGRSLQGASALQRRGMIMREDADLPFEEELRLLSGSDPEEKARFLDRAAGFSNRAIERFDAYREPLATLSGRLGIGGESVETQFQALEQMLGGDLAKLTPDQVKQRVAEFDRLTEITGIAADKMISFIQASVDMAERYGRSGTVAARASLTSLAQARFAMADVNQLGITANGSKMAEFYEQAASSYATSSQYNTQLAARAVFTSTTQKFSGSLGEIQRIMEKMEAGGQLTDEEKLKLTQGNIERAFRAAGPAERRAFAAVSGDQTRLNQVAETGIGEKFLGMAHEFQWFEEFAATTKTMRAQNKNLAGLSDNEIMAGIAAARVRKVGETGALDVDLLTTILGDRTRATAVSRQFGSGLDLTGSFGAGTMTPEQARAFIAQRGVAARIAGFQSEASVNRMFSEAAGKGGLETNAMKLITSLLEFDINGDKAAQLKTIMEASLGLENPEDVVLNFMGSDDLLKGAADIDKSGDRNRREGFLRNLAILTKGSKTASALLSEFATSGSLTDLMGRLKSSDKNVREEVRAAFEETKRDQAKTKEQEETDAKKEEERKQAMEAERERTQALLDVGTKAADVLTQVITKGINESNLLPAIERPRVAPREEAV